MANPKDLIFTIIKWAICIICIVILVKLSVDLVQNGKHFNTQKIIYYILTYIVLLFGLFGAWKEEFLYLVICGVALILDLIFSFSAETSNAPNNGLIVALTVLVCICAVMIRFGSARSVSMA